MLSVATSRHYCFIKCFVFEPEAEAEQSKVERYCDVMNRSYSRVYLTTVL